MAVLYDPGDPERVRVDSPMGRVACLEAVFIPMGGGVAALGIVVLIVGH